MSDIRSHVEFTWLTSRRGGQHTNGPDYGVMRCEHGLTGVVVEIQTRSRMNQHKARDLCLVLIELAVAEIDHS